MERVRVSSPAEAKRPVSMIEKGIDHGDEGRLGETLVNQVAIETRKHLCRGNQTVLVSKALLRPQSLLDENRQETCGHSVAHRIGDVEADVVFVEPEHIIEIAADLSAQ